MLRGGQFYLWNKLEYLEKTFDLEQVTDKLYHGIRIHNFSGDRYWCKSNYNAITTTTALFLIEDRTKLEKWICV
jgi:hypothetical protein